MASQRKLNLTSDQRKALLRNQVSSLLWHGRIETTLARAKEIRSIAEKMVTLAIREHDRTVGAKKEYHNEKGQIVAIDVVNDAPSKLHARRLLMAYLYDFQEIKKKDESKSEYKERTKDNRHPLVEKLFRDYGPKYRARNAQKDCAGGYTRISRLGPRRGDAAEMCIIEML